MIREELIISHVIQEHGAQMLIEEARMLSANLANPRISDRSTLVDLVYANLQRGIDLMHSYYKVPASYSSKTPKGKVQDYAEMVKTFKMLRKMNVFEKLEQM